MPVMLTSPYRLVTALEQPQVFDQISDVIRQTYPPFLTQDFLDSESWHRLFQLYPEFQFGVIETATQHMVAQGNCLPLSWQHPLEQLPDTGCDWALTTGLTATAPGQRSTVLSAVSIAVMPDYQGQGLGRTILDQMLTIARSHQLNALILAVRPSLKHLYPLTPMERYLTWTNDRGQLFDPWLRTIVQHGAQLRHVCSQSTTMIDPIAAWEQKLNLRLPETGDYIIPGGLVPLHIDYATHQGSYIEPNVWLSYVLS